MNVVRTTGLREGFSENGRFKQTSKERIRISNENGVCRRRERKNILNRGHMTKGARAGMKGVKLQVESGQ